MSAPHGQPLDQQGGYHAHQGVYPTVPSAPPAPPEQQGAGVGAVGGWSGGALEELVSKVELRVECKTLMNKDLASKSDPIAVLYMLVEKSYKEVGRTEKIKDCLNPRFTKPFIVDFYFEEVQKVQISIYDVDNETYDLNDDDYLGSIETTLGQIVSNKSFTKPLMLTTERKAGNGVITVHAEELKKTTGIVTMHFSAENLDNKELFSKSDPFLEIERPPFDDPKSWMSVHKTGVVKNNLSPSWPPVELSLHALCLGDRQWPIKFTVYDWERDGNHDLIGSFTTTLEKMLEAEPQKPVIFPVINMKKKAKKKKYENSGVVKLSSIKIEITENHTFLDFVFGGMQINFTVAIDFTQSNGDPKNEKSLHYINPNPYAHRPNEYQQAIRAVGDVCQDYDTDQRFPVLGFGAQLPSSSSVSHKFAVNFNETYPSCFRIDGVLEAYAECIKRVRLSGPTHASPIIEHVASEATNAQEQEGQRGAHAYFILLMMTDGILSDMDATKMSIVKASHLPMSIIIVGVGGGDFTNMNVLDSDKGLLKAHSGAEAVRDIVQFVEFRKYKEKSAAELAKEVLKEVPKQVTGYYNMRKLKPNVRAQPAPGPS